MAKVGRKSNGVTEEQKQEADEILQLALKEVGGVKTNLTYNKVVTFNEKIANDPKYTRSNGKLYNNYGTRFWARDYNGSPYYGKQIIDKLKNGEIKVAGEVFQLKHNLDISALVKKYHKKPDELTLRLVKLFSKNDDLIKDLNLKVEQLEKKKNEAEKKLEQYKRGVVNMFNNSSSTYNSLEDVLSLSRPHDGKVQKDLLNIFESKEDMEKSFKVVDVEKHISIQLNNDNVVDLSDKLNQMGMLSAEDEGF